MAQNNHSDGYIYMKCGTSIGNASEIISACSSALPEFGKYFCKYVRPHEDFILMV